MSIRKLGLNGFDYRKIELLKDITDEDFEKIKNGIALRSYDRGDLIFSTGHPSDKMYLLLEGKIKISKYLSDGKEQLLYIYKKDEFIGGHNIISSDPYEYNAESLTDVILLIISSKIVEDILINNNNFLLKILDQSFERIRMAEELIDRLSIISSDTKVAKLLLSLDRHYGENREGRRIISYNTTQEEIASLAGISRETLSRRLNQFEDDGLIKILSRGEILVKNKAKLKEYSL